MATSSTFQYSMMAEESYEVDMCNDSTTIRPPTFGMPCLERPMLDLSRLNLNDRPSSPAPQTPINTLKKRKPSCVTPPGQMPPLVYRANCIRRWEEKQVGNENEDWSYDSLCSDESTGSLRKRLRRSANSYLGCPAPMLPNSPEMEANDYNPFQRHRPQYSPVMKSTAVNLEFLEEMRNNLKEEERTDSFSQFVFDISGNSLPCLAVPGDEDAVQLAPRKTLKIRPKASGRLPLLPLDMP